MCIRDSTQLLYQIDLLVNAKALSQVTEHNGAVLFELEMTRHIVSATDYIHSIACKPTA